MHACMPSYVGTYITACIHTYIHTYIRTYVHTYLHSCRCPKTLALIQNFLLSRHETRCTLLLPIEGDGKTEARGLSRPPLELSSPRGDCNLNSGPPPYPALRDFGSLRWANTRSTCSFQGLYSHVLKCWPQQITSMSWSLAPDT